MGILKLDKKRGETPLECMNRFKVQDERFKDEKMTYAGRLDPMAEGLLLVIYGEEIKNKEKYLGLDKEYEVEILFGFATDTYDILGKVAKEILGTLPRLPKRSNVEDLLKSFVGKFSQKYPPYSSKYFNKARSGELHDEDITTKDVEIKSIEIIGEKTISKFELEKFVKDSISLVNGDFRQDEIIKSWEFTMVNSQLSQDFIFPIIKIKVTCTSGTYMRSLANEIGKKIGILALAMHIKRTRIGDFSC